ncbi:SDR family NAD(P)-dependent oxidoreductase [Paenibacillus antri]|uniref:SDR family NAD(P)-dependent oxidoreductase n=1 Tax=Paenibacillus antri TaxID=2582848 RepID=A0A5R9GD20_9BACL|nr:SDR family NAD(P)-dependent oxidoreductase [Paenibacillus antri]TLS52216.1 SDR family NAD(P)-dependent oxidoreductase [Paenibacillus antri]
MAGNYYIITGASRGLGESLTRRLLQEDHVVYGLSRTENREVAAFARSGGFKYRYRPVDLAFPEEASKVLHEILSDIPSAEAGTISLINNAATVSPLTDLSSCSDEDIVRNININFTSPVVLQSTFLRMTSDSVKKRMVVNITSASAQFPAGGMSLYCSAKAGLDMLTKCAALEQVGENPVKIIAVDPGMMDTSMQSTAREANIGLSDYFKAQKLEGKLKGTDAVAKEIISLLGRYLLEYRGDGEHIQKSNRID